MDCALVYCLVFVSSEEFFKACEAPVDGETGRQVETLLFLLAKGGSSLMAEKRYSDGRTGLHQAVLAGNAGRVEMLVENGAPVRTRIGMCLHDWHGVAWPGTPLAARCACATLLLDFAYFGVIVVCCLYR